MHDMCVRAHVIAVFIIVLLNQISGVPTTAAAAAEKIVRRRQSRPPAVERAKNGSVSTSYYQHNPYGPNTYAFGFEVNDNRTGNVQFRDERRYLNGSVQGSYGYVRPDGRVTITHFLSDAQRGYLSHTQTFSRGAETGKWEAHWPTQRPTAMLGGQHEALPLNVTHDKEQRLNVTVGNVAQATADALKEQHGMQVEVNPLDVVGNVLAPSLLDILNGQVPVQKKPIKGGDSNTTIGFETVHNFIPNNFPLTPFEPPHTNAQPPQLISQTTTTSAPIKENKYDSAKVNNAEKTHRQQVATLNVVEKNTPRPLSGPINAADADPKWYESVINETRREFLENLPNL